MVPYLRDGRHYRTRPSRYKFIDFHESIENGAWVGREHSIDLEGVESFYVNGLLHSENGNWARKHPDGTVEWYQYGELHRVFGPAIIYNDGSKRYFKNGKEFFPDTILRKYVSFKQLQKLSYGI